MPLYGAQPKSCCTRLVNWFSDVRFVRAYRVTVTSVPTLVVDRRQGNPWITLYSADKECYFGGENVTMNTGFYLKEKVWLPPIRCHLDLFAVCKPGDVTVVHVLSDY